MDILIGDELLNRKLIYQVTSDLIIEKLNTESITFYIGTDLTAPSLHLGHSLWLKTVGRLVKAGHKAIILLGGFTSKIGDPHGKNQARKTLDEETVNFNKEKIRQQIYRLMPENGSVMIVDNSEWLNTMSYGTFLEEYAKFASVNSMLKMETVS
jgi:tyrosyl-tRNA synthetase